MVEEFNLDPGYKFTLDSVPRGKNSSPILNTCNTPTRAVTIDLNSNCFLCICDGWLPIPVGKVLDFETLEAVFDNPTAKVLQQDVHDKKYTWCAVDHCGIKHRDIVKKRYELVLDIDESCNLACPSCRRDLVMHTQGPEIENKKQAVNRIVSWLENFDHPIHITMSGNGDPLASTIIRPLFQNLVPRPNQTFKLFTNGLLIKKQLASSSILPQVTEISISVDAGRAETYEVVRLGGSWKVLMENFDFLKEHDKSKMVTLNFAVQNNNFQEIPDFVELCQQYGFAAHIHQLDDWGTWNNTVASSPDAWTVKHGTFIDHNVLNPNHKNFAECKNIIQNLINANSYRVFISPRVKQIVNNE
jgi:sulfatase maturation enzyme AslB (radical SAM superfamily)